MNCRIQKSTGPLSLETLTISYWEASRILRAPVANYREYMTAREFMVVLASADPEDVPDYIRHLARCDLFELSEKHRPDSTWRRVDEVAAFLVARARSAKETPAIARIFPEDGPQGAA